MRTPDGLAPLFEYGILDEVVRPLMSGKEAQVYLVRSGGQLCVAKVYKEAQQRTFKNRAEYTEGRKVRNSRDQRAIGKRSKHGRAEDEAAWRSTEVDVIHRLHAGGVRVPTPFHFVEGVLLMELVTDAEGDPAPRLGDLQFTPGEARAIYDRLIREVVRMLCAGVVHGDLSCFNVLVGADGPVIIDFPQSVDTARNTNARKLLLRDVENLHEFLRRFVRGARRLPYAEEMWDLYQQNLLTPETPLNGGFRGSRASAPVNLNGVLDLIQEAHQDELRRRQALGGGGRPREQPERPRPQQDPPAERPQIARPPQAPLPPGERPSPPTRHPVAPGNTRVQGQRDQRPMQGQRDQRPTEGQRDQRSTPSQRDDRSPPPQRDNRPQEPRREGRAADPRRDRGSPEPRQDRRPMDPQHDRGGPQPQPDRGSPVAQQDRRGPRPQQDRRPPYPQQDRRPPEPQQDRRPPEPPQERRPPEAQRERHTPDAQRGHPAPEAQRTRPPPDSQRNRPPPDSQRNRPQNDGQRGRPAPEGHRGRTAPEVLIMRKRPPTT
jgi:RIO kinase 1